MSASQTIEAVQAGEESQPDIGARLRAAREAQELSLDDVAAELRISAPALAALEENRFEALGAPVFAKGYLKQYGARLGLAIDELAADYERSVGEASIRIAPSQTIKLRDERQITIWIVSGLLLALLVVFLVLWWLRQSGPPAVPAAGGEPAAEPIAESAVPTADPAVPEAAGDEPAATAESIAAGTETSAVEPAATAAAGGVAPASLAAPPETAGPGAGESAATAAVPAAARAGLADPAPTAAAGEAPAAIQGPVLEVFFAEDSWTEITDGAGERLFYDIGEAGTRRRFPADPALNLLFGNAGGVELSVDGRALLIPGSPRSGEVAQFALGTLID